MDQIGNNTVIYGNLSNKCAYIFQFSTRVATKQESRQKKRRSSTFTFDSQWTESKVAAMSNFSEKKRKKIAYYTHKPFFVKDIIPFLVDSFTRVYDIWFPLLNIAMNTEPAGKTAEEVV